LKNELIEGQRLARSMSGAMSWSGRAPRFPLSTRPLPRPDPQTVAGSSTRLPTWLRRSSRRAAPWKASASRSRCCSPI
jgi:hypothetical protein